MKQRKEIELINALNTCAIECNYCVASCLEEPDVKMMTACIKLDLDCASICSLTASFIARISVHGKHLLKECIELCSKCAAECEKHTHMQHCIDCAKACRECEKICRAAA